MDLKTEVEKLDRALKHSMNCTRIANEKLAVAETRIYDLSKSLSQERSHNFDLRKKLATKIVKSKGKLKVSAFVDMDDLVQEIMYKL